MSEIHSALKSLGPADWDTVPTSESELDQYLVELFGDAQLVLDSVPIPEPDESKKSSRSRSDTQNSATKASEVSPSLERTVPVAGEHKKLQKEWGKTVKLKQSENPLEMSVYKLGAKDGKGAWFARRSVHEGIGFAKFKKSLEQEFPQSMLESGPPGTGNIRGIGGEERVENVTISKQGQIEVYRLSAQFPGPTTPRDFVTMLVTSAGAMDDNNQKGKDTKLPPRYYMIISKPCNHPKTQPQSGFIRGFYESVEFIREVPRRSGGSQSEVNLNKLEQKSHIFHGQTEGQPSSAHEDEGSKRQRATTVGTSSNANKTDEDAYDPESNPVEWIMITRSDPGGSVPRFMVERGTPSSICADAVKFLDWACSNDFSDQPNKDETKQKPIPNRRESFQSHRARSTIGVEEHARGVNQEETKDEQQIPSEHVNHGLWGTVTDMAASLRPYAPQMVLDRLPGQEVEDNEEIKSIKSTTSFASAEDHLSSSASSSASSTASSSANISSPSSHRIASPTPDPNVLSATKQKKDKKDKEKKSSKDKPPKDPLAEHERRIQSLKQKHTETMSKFQSSTAKQQTDSEKTLAKALAKHEREIQKQEARYERDLQRLEKKKEKEKKKQEEKSKRAKDKDEKGRLRRERDESRVELEGVRKENEELRGLVRELRERLSGYEKIDDVKDGVSGGGGAAAE